MDPARLAEFRRRTDNLSTGDYPRLAPPLEDPAMQRAIDRLVGGGKKRRSGHGKGDDTRFSHTASTSLLFNRLDFERDREGAQSGTTASSKKTPGTKSRLPKDPAVALTKVASRQARLAALAERDPKAAAAAQERDSWSRAIERASGVAVRDDPKLLKRALARRRRQKEVKRERWEERQTQVQEEQQRKQEKRRENIQKRKDTNKQKKSRK